MSDVAPPLEDQGPPAEEPPVPRRGIRAGKSAQRKRKAYIRYRLETEPDLTLDQIYLVHADKTQRPLYSRAGWTPGNLDQEDEDCVVVEVEEPSAAAPKASIASSSSKDPEPVVAETPSASSRPTAAVRPRRGAEN